MATFKDDAAECPHITSCVGLMALSILSSNQITETPYCRSNYTACPLHQSGMIDGMPAFARVAPGAKTEQIAPK